jgi:soluble lytic murein transglycosylase-like protein
MGRNRSQRLRFAIVAVLILLVFTPGAVPPVASVSSVSVPSATATPGEVAHAGHVSKLFAALSRCQASLPENERWRIAGTIEQESLRYGYDPLFVQAMIEVESGCRPQARGPKGAIGLIQVKPSTARAVAKEAGLPWSGPDTLHRPVLNVRLGLRYLAQLERLFGNPYLAMAAYNMGPARAARLSPLRAQQSRYVRKILSRYERLLADHAVRRS